MTIQIIDGLNYIRDMLEHRGQTLATMYRRHAATPPGDVEIWVWEGKGGNQRRRDLYPEYKGKRPVASEDVFKSVRLFQELMMFSDSFQIKVDTYEGDDVIAQLVDMYADQHGVFIWSTDKDFRQLLRGPETGPGSVRTLSTPDADGVSDKYIRLAKTYIGDKSDNITGVVGFGEVGFFDMKYHWDELMRRHATRDLEGIERCWGNMKPKPYTWAMANIEKIQMFWDITGFYLPGEEVVRKALTKGTRNPAAAEHLMRQYLIT